MYGRALANSSGSINHLDKGISKMCVWEYFDLLTGYTVIRDRLRLLLDQKNPSRRPVTTHTYIYDTRKHLNLEARNILIVRRNHGSNIHYSRDDGLGGYPVLGHTTSCQFASKSSHSSNILGFESCIKLLLKVDGSTSPL